MRVVKLPYNLNPRPYQFEIMQAFFRDRIKRMILIQHRRAGKDLLCFNIMIMAALQRVGTYLYTFPLMKQARKVIWEGKDKHGTPFLSYIPPNLIAGTHDTKMNIYLKNGSIITLSGCDNYDGLLGTNPVGIVHSEFTIQHPNVWRLFSSPILKENGGWVIFNGTPRGHNYAYDLYKINEDNPAWFVKTHNITSTTISPGIPVVSEESIEEERRAGVKEEIIQQEYYCSFDMPVPGAYYATEMAACVKENRICDIEIDPRYPVFTFWDLGHTDACAVTFVQMVVDDIRIINYYEGHQKSIGEVAEEVHKFRVKHKLTYKKHFAPHDILQGGEKGGQFSDGKSRVKHALSKGIKFDVVPTSIKTREGKKKILIVDGINAVRTLFPRIRFHKENTIDLVQALMHYHAQYNETTDYYGKPNHDWSCHGADTIRYLATVWDKTMLQQNWFDNVDGPIRYQGYA